MSFLHEGERMYIHDTPMAVCGATQALEALKLGVAHLLRHVEPEQLLKSLWYLAKLKKLPIDEGEFLSLIEQAENAPDEIVNSK